MPRFNFWNLSVAAASICLGLAVVWAVAPAVMLKIWSVESSYSTILMARRGAALFLGLAIIFFRARQSEPSVIRSALASGMLVSCIVLASLGLFEFFTGHAGSGILSAVVVEILLALSFFRFVF